MNEHNENPGRYTRAFPPEVGTRVYVLYEESWGAVIKGPNPHDPNGVAVKLDSDGVIVTCDFAQLRKVEPAVARERETR